MNSILSCFDGISAGQVCLNKLGIPFDKYYASEIDENSIKVTQHNFQNTIQLGDIKNWKEWNIDWKSIDLLLFGFPCENFSILKYQNGFKGNTGSLFFIARDILNHIKKYNPNVKFLAENVPMKEEYSDIISQELNVKFEQIDSKEFSAQNRIRNYWFNWKYEKPHSQCQLVLGNILELDTEFEWYEKPFDFYGEDSVICGKLDLNGHDFIKRVQSKNFKSQCLTGISGGSQEKKVYINGKVRKLTVNEYSRLMGFEDNYCSLLSRTRARSALGNSWQVDTVLNILKQLDYELQ